ncbi:MAG: phosphoribosyltransferase [Actinobacteria bacterium]|nr:MAG: phosphoribosyltransferase [Actinomycetota bacterium]
MFKDRKEAGNLLASELSYLKDNSVIVAIPRGGVVIGAEVAKELKLPLTIIVPRKIGAPDNPELAIGAVAGEGSTFLNERIIKTLGVTNEYLTEEIRHQVEEIKRREKSYLRGKKSLSVEDKIAILVDDGLATGATATVAVRALKEQNPEKVILAVPVAPEESKLMLGKEADEVIVLQTPAMFYAVGQFYQFFEQTTDEEVKDLLEEFN